MKQLVLLCTWLLLHRPASNRQQISILHKDHWPCLGETVLVSLGSYLPLAMPFYWCSQKPHSSLIQAPRHLFKVKLWGFPCWLLWCVARNLQGWDLTFKSLRNEKYILLVPISLVSSACGQYTIKFSQLVGVSVSAEQLIGVVMCIQESEATWATFAHWGGTRTLPPKLHYWFFLTVPPLSLTHQKTVHELITPSLNPYHKTSHYTPQPPRQGGIHSFEGFNLLSSLLPGKAIKLYLFHFTQNSVSEI